MKLGRVLEGFIFTSWHVGEEGSPSDVLLASQRKRTRNSTFEGSEKSVETLMDRHSRLQSPTSSQKLQMFSGWQVALEEMGILAGALVRSDTQEDSSAGRCVPALRPWQERGALPPPYMDSGRSQVCKLSTS